MVALVLLVPLDKAAFEDATGFVEARRSVFIPARTGCTSIYAYDVAGETYRTLISGRSCPEFAMVQYVVAKPWRARRQPSGVGPPPPPAPPPSRRP